MIRVATRKALRDAIGELRASADPPHRVALVPTMGFLHEGHLSLVDVARERADAVVLSAFVNPLQFGPDEDLDTYPRDLDRDVGIAEKRGVDVFFAPDEGEMYPDGEPIVRVVPGRMGDRLCGAYRPGHFRGVLTVVAKLFHLVEPDVAVFGQKDYQQVALIRRMVRDLDLPVDIVVAPIVREADGMARSSRNVHLDPDQRAAATVLHRALTTAVDAFRSGETNAERLRTVARAILAEEPAVRVQYVDLVDPNSLETVDTAEARHVLAVAAFVGGVRLIDNVIILP